MKKGELGNVELSGVPCTPFIYALSGGVDSVSLLHWLVGQGYRPVVAHFNHHWHAREDKDAEFCCELAKKWGLKFVLGSTRKGRGTTEEIARHDRYAFLVKIAKRLNCKAIMVAHTANDQAETVLMRLIRGAGTRGLSGIRFSASRGGMSLLRPWLNVLRKDIVLYARKNKLKWCEDPVNLDTRRLRARIRHRLMPYLERFFNVSIERQLCRTATLLEEDESWLDVQAEKALAEAREVRRPQRLVLLRLRKLPICLRRRVIKKWLESEKIRDISFDDVEAILGLLSDLKKAKVNLANHRYVRRKEQRLFVQ